jgi:prolipoprotein diacylglyceryl transferase
MGGPLELRYYSLLFVAVFLGGYSLLKWQITRAGGPASDAGDFIVYGVLGVLLGARLGHVLFYDLDKALKDPMWVFKIWTGGLASHGAVIGLIFVMWLFCKQKGISFFEGSDRFSYSATLGATLVRVGNLMNSEIVGRKTDQSWGFQFPRYDRDLVPVPYRYPTQLAEIVLGCLVMAGLYFIDKRLGEEKRPRGAMIASFFALYFTGRFFVEFYKEYEGPLEAGSALTMGQVLSLPGIIIGWGGLYLALKKKVPAEWPALEEEEEAPRRKKKSQKAAAPKDEEEDEEDDDRREDDEDESGRDERDDDDASDDDDDDGKRRGDDDDDEEEDDDADEDDGESAPHRERPERDSDVDDEFDDKGALKKRRD